MGADHARIVAEDLPGAKLQLLCDMSRECAKAVADLYGAGEVVTEPNDVARRNDVDAVIVASPHPTHAPLSLLAIQARKPGFVKNLCRSRRPSALK